MRERGDGGVVGRAKEHRHAITGHSGGGVGRMYGTSVPLSVLAEHGEGAVSGHRSVVSEDYASAG